MGVLSALKESFHILSQITKSTSNRVLTSIIFFKHVVRGAHYAPPRPIPSSIALPVYAKTGEVPNPPREVEIKTKEQIDAVRSACQIARKVAGHAKDFIKVGVTTEDLDSVLHHSIIDYGAYPSPLNYKGFPKSVCTSVNNVAVHGIPDSYSLKDGDIISVDISVYYGGVHGDLCETFLVGNVDDAGRKLVDISRKCLDSAICQCGPGVRFSTIGNTISSLAKQHGFSVSPYCYGHGIGSVFHALPDICHVANNYPGRMAPGMTFTIEPVIHEGSSGIQVLDDGWTMIATDGKRASQFEETILITDSGIEILTQEQS
ncbi:methionine aminopeptidase 1D, mitochondrial-like isoform X2 [Actinia tenebrosa]|uniref:Methionine aminopeptidase n=1 Tax=Actinia tenebrosa TaxID=6105 RepID=A0A6P8H3R6_ACTTE|nr:methionine aminopeptidase 1D, mitochondrial-like isoform X2 [Actinia tenebrosa]